MEAQEAFDLCTGKKPYPKSPISKSVILVINVKEKVTSNHVEDEEMEPIANPLKKILSPMRDTTNIIQGLNTAYSNVICRYQIGR